MAGEPDGDACLASSFNVISCTKVCMKPCTYEVVKASVIRQLELSKLVPLTPTLKVRVSWLAGLAGLVIT